MIVEWFATSTQSLTWFGQTQETLAAIKAQNVSAIATIIGPRGLSAGEALISNDDDNIITTGTDDGLYAPPPQLATSQW